MSAPFAQLSPHLREAALAAAQALRAGQADAARRRFERLLRQVPNDPDLLRLAGMAQRQCGRHELALATLHRACKLAPEDALAASSLGLACMAAGRHAEGVAALRRACGLAPQAAGLHNNLGKALIDCGRAAEAVAPLRAALDLQPDLLPARFSLAYALTVTGLLDGGDIARLGSLLAAGGEADNRIALGHARGQALHEAERFPQAFAAFAAANALHRAREPWDAAAFTRRVDAFLDTAWPVAAPTGDVPGVVFIVSLPRSGSSLLERMLAMHPDVVAGGELDVLGRVLEQAARRAGGTLPDTLADLPGVAWEGLGTAYLDGARSGLAARPVLVDKRPGNWLFVGAALAMLPDARVIVCRRDPVETCFSCWRHRFARGTQSFANDFTDLGTCWRQFDRACRHWQARYPERVMELRYEALVEDPEPVVRQLLAFCRLPWAPACLHPEQASGEVHTLSATQVRQPLNPNTAVAARYGTLLDPLRTALAGDAASAG